MLYGGVPPVIFKYIVPSKLFGDDGSVPKHSTPNGNTVKTSQSFLALYVTAFDGVGVGVGVLVGLAVIVVVTLGVGVAVGVENGVAVGVFVGLGVTLGV